MTLGELLKKLNKLKASCDSIGEDWEDAPIRIYGEHGEVRKVEVDLVGMTLQMKIDKE